MSYVINIMYGENTRVQRFRFDSDNKVNSDEKFDEAVKEINRLYKENGRYKTMNEVLQHFGKYGFYRTAL